MDQLLRTLLLLLIARLPASFHFSGAVREDGGWGLDSSLQDEGECNIEIRDANSITHTEFIKEYAYAKPVLLRGLTDNTKFRFLCTKSSLLREYGDKTVRLSTANTHSYRKVDVRFEEFVKFLLTPQSEDTLGSDTLYFFGDNNFTEWRSLFEEYKAPPFSLPLMHPAYSFGIAVQFSDHVCLRYWGVANILNHTSPTVSFDNKQNGPGTGVPFHWHGPGYSEVIYGRKRWFLYPPDLAPEFHPNRTTLSWVSQSYLDLELHQRPLECTIRPGEVLYFPDRWWHATLNLDTSVFISTFLG